MYWNIKSNICAKRALTDWLKKDYAINQTDVLNEKEGLIMDTIINRSCEYGIKEIDKPLIVQSVEVGDILFYDFGGAL